MATETIVKAVDGIRLKNYVHDIRCPTCGEARDAGMFLVNEREGDPLAFVQAPACTACTGTVVDYVPGMFVRSLHGDDGKPVTWQQRRRKGKVVAAYGAHRDIREMQFRLMKETLQVLPQPNLQSGLQHREGEHTPSLFDQPKKRQTRRAPAAAAPPPPAPAPEVSMHEDAMKVIEAAVSQQLAAIGEDAGRSGLQQTPHRVAKSMLRDLFAGYGQDPKEHVTLFDEESYDGIVLVADIPLVSTCEHHMLPFTGVCHIAYIPGTGKVLGLSKFARIVDVFARRLQVQERLTQQIATFLEENLQPQALLVEISAEHTCMTLRGVQKPGSHTSTATLRGAFKTNADSRAEVYQLLANRSR